MCNLYRMTKNKDEVAQWFDANIPAELRARHGAVD